MRGTGYRTQKGGHLNKATQSLVTMLVAVLLLFVAACSSSDSSGVTSASPTASPPSRAEVLAAFKRLAPKAGFDYPIELSPEPEEAGTFGAVLVKAVTQDAEGRWLASAELVPPAYASSNPAPIFIAQYPDGWRLANSLEAAVLRTSSPAPIATDTAEP